MDNRLETFLFHEGDGVFIIGHSSCIVKMNGRLIFCDPVWGDYRPYGENWKFVPTQIDCTETIAGPKSLTVRKDIIAVFVSHMHADHWSEDVQYLFNCSTYIKSGRPDLRCALEKICHVTEFDSLHWFNIDRDIEACFFKHPFNSVDSAYAIRNKKTGYTVYVGNDCWQDEAGCKKIKELVGRIDVSLLPYAMVSFYPALLTGISEEERRNETIRLKKVGLDQFKMFVDICRPKASIPFGNSLFYIDGVDSPLNRDLARPHELEGALVLLAGDTFLSDGISSRPWSADKYEDMIHAWSNLSRVQDRVSRATTKIQNHYIFVNYVAISPNNLTVEFETSPQINSGIPITAFKIEPREFEKWIYGEWTFEQVLGSRRFTFERRPNVYDPKIIDWVTRFL